MPVTTFLYYFPIFGHKPERGNFVCHQPQVPLPPLKGPTMLLVIQPP